jgi:uncharacterized protein with GYD domain
MSKYLTKMTFTTQAWAALVQEPQNRLEGVRPFFEAAGFKLLEYWFAVDQGAVYMLSEGPDNLSNQLALQMATLGGGTLASLEGSRLLTAADAVEAMKKAKTFGYRPPFSATPAKK